MENKKGFSRLFWNFYTKNIVLAIVLSIGLVFLVLFWLNKYTRHNEAISVPDVKGQQVEQAETLLGKSKLRFAVIDSVYTKDKAPGAIVEQNPPADARVKENRIIFLTINARAQKKIAVPDMRDNSYRQAVATLESLGFQIVDIVRKPSEYKDLVLDVTYRGQSITNNQELPIGSPLTIIVGSGEPEAPSDSVIIINEKEESWF